MYKKKHTGLIISLIITILIIATLMFALYKMWFVPSQKQSELVNEIKDVSPNKVSELVDNYNSEVEAQEEASQITIPDMTNDVIDNTSWVNYDDGTVISFKDGYFVWYSDDSMSNDNYLLGEFELYTGKDAFNLLRNVVDTELEQADTDSVLIMKVMSKKVDGEETLEEETDLYLFGYYTETIMSYIDLTTYNEYTFLRVDTETASDSETEAVETTAESEATEALTEE